MSPVSVSSDPGVENQIAVERQFRPPSLTAIRSITDSLVEVAAGDTIFFEVGKDQRHALGKIPQGSPGNFNYDSQSRSGIVFDIEGKGFYFTHPENISSQTVADTLFINHFRLDEQLDIPGIAKMYTEQGALLGLQSFLFRREQSNPSNPNERLKAVDLQEAQNAYSFVEGIFEEIEKTGSAANIRELSALELSTLSKILPTYIENAVSCREGQVPDVQIPLEVAKYYISVLPKDQKQAGKHLLMDTFGNLDAAPQWFTGLTPLLMSSLPGVRPEIAYHEKLSDLLDAQLHGRNKSFFIAVALEFSEFPNRRMLEGAASILNNAENQVEDAKAILNALGRRPKSLRDETLANLSMQLFDSEVFYKDAKSALKGLEIRPDLKVRARILEYVQNFHESYDSQSQVVKSESWRELARTLIFISRIKNTEPSQRKGGGNKAFGQGLASILEKFSTMDSKELASIDSKLNCPAISREIFQKNSDFIIIAHGIFQSLLLTNPMPQFTEAIAATIKLGIGMHPKELPEGKKGFIYPVADYLNALYEQRTSSFFGLAKFVNFKWYKERRLINSLFDSEDSSPALKELKKRLDFDVQGR